MSSGHNFFVSVYIILTKYDDLLNVYKGYFILPVNTKTPNATINLICVNTINLICVNSIQVYFDDKIVSVDALHASQQNFSHFGTFPEIKQ